MTSIIKNLCWKEFHELKSGVLSAAAIILSIPLCYVFRDASDSYFGIYPAFGFYPLIAGVFFGMRAAAGERTSRTATFVAGLPVSHRLLGAIRLLSSLVAAAVPLVALLLLGTALSPWADQLTKASVQPLAATFGLSLLATTCCITIAAAMGTGQPSEVRAGAVGLVAMLIVGLVGWVAFLLCLAWLEEAWQSEDVPRPKITITLLGLTLPVLATIGFFTRFITRYSFALGPFVDRRSRRWSMGNWMPTPVPAPIAALIWKGSREMGVLGLQVFLGAVLLSFVVSVVEHLDNSRRGLFDLMLQALPVILWAGGFVLAILIGVGTAIADLQPGVNTFWRSRPISPRAWYWTKYGIGLVTLLVAIELPLLLSPSHDKDINVFSTLLLWVVTFSFALTATCLVRQPAHAAILAVGAVGLLYSAVKAMFDRSMSEPVAAMPVLVAVFLVAFVVSTILGAWAAENDVAIS